MNALDFLSSLSSQLIVVLGSGALLAIGLLVRPVVLLWLTTLLTLTIAGLVVYFVPSMGHLWWVTYGTAFLLYVLAAISVQKSGQRPCRYSSPLMAISVGTFLVVTVLSTTLALPPAFQLLVSVKSLFMFGGLWAFFSFVPLKEQIVRKWLKSLLIIGVVQWLFALYQYIFIRGLRLQLHLGTVEASDSVVGTFGGSTESGGLSAVLALFLVSSIIVVVAYYREGLVSKRRLALLLTFLAMPLLLMEVKVFFIYLPVSLLILFRREIIHRPLMFFGTGTIIVALLGGALYAYQVFHWSSAGGGLSENVEHSFGYSFQSEADYWSRGYGSLTRVGTLFFWWEENGMDSPAEMLIGHGLGASRTQGQVIGQAAARYPKNIDRTGLALMLWDVGVLGVLGLFGVLLAAFLLAGKLGKSLQLLPWQRALAYGLQAIVPLFLLSLPYRNDIPYAAPMMFIVMSTFGLISWLNRQAMDTVQKQ